MTLDQAALRELELAIADRLFIQIANWNLYLGDAGVAEALAIECNAHLDKTPDLAARKALESVQVQLAGGSMKLPLSRLIPPGPLYDLEEILSAYC